MARAGRRYPSHVIRAKNLPGKLAIHGVETGSVGGATVTATKVAVHSIESGVVGGATVDGIRVRVHPIESGDVGGAAVTGSKVGISSLESGVVGGAVVGGYKIGVGVIESGCVGGTEIVTSSYIVHEPVPLRRPNWAGFEDAQIRLRAAFGNDVEFFAPTGTTYASGVALDPETGRPYDPTIKPIASGWASAVVHGDIVDRPMGLSQGGVADQRLAGTPLGSMPVKQKVVIIGSADVGLASAATRARYLDEDFAVTDFREDKLGPVVRFLAFLEQR